MIKLKLITVKKSFPKDHNILSNFESPFILYIRHKDDDSKFFMSFVIADCKNREYIYINSYLPENVEKIDEYNKHWKLLYTNMPHSHVWIRGSSRFLVFDQDPNFIYDVDYWAWVLNILVWVDDFNEIWVWELLRFSSTSYIDPQDDSRFIFSSVVRNLWEYYYWFFSANRNLSNIKTLWIIKKDDKDDVIYHVIRKYKNKLLLSNFNWWLLHYKKKWGVVKLMDYLDIVQPKYDKYKKYFSVFKKLTMDKAKKDLFLKKALDDVFEWILINRDYSEKYYNMFVWDNPINILEFTELTDFAVDLMPWEINVYDLDNQAYDVYSTTYWRPAHFEIDYELNEIFVSSHNFIHMDKKYFQDVWPLDKKYYFWPAAIDKYILNKDWKLEFVWNFVEERWYRFTSHKVFNYKWVRYLVTVGHPNRLFLINADSLEKIFCYDIWQDVLSDKVNVLSFQNNTDLYWKIWLNVLADKWVVLIIDDMSIKFFSIDEKNLIFDLPYIYNTDLYNDLNLQDFRNWITHLDYLYN